MGTAPKAVPAALLGARTKQESQFNDVVLGKPRLIKQGDEKGNRVIKNSPQLLLIIPSISHKEQSFGLRMQFLSAILKGIITHPGN